MAYIIQIDTYIFKGSCCAVNSAKAVVSYRHVLKLHLKIRDGEGEREWPWHMKTKTFNK